MLVPIKNCQTTGGHRITCRNLSAATPSCDTLTPVVNIQEHIPATGGDGTVNQQRQRTRGGRIGVRAVVLIMTLGFVLGVWKFMGQGEPIWSPHWLANAWETTTNWLQWNHDTTQNIVDQVPDVQLTLPTAAPITLPTSLPTP